MDGSCSSSLIQRGQEPPALAGLGMFDWAEWTPVVVLRGLLNAHDIAVLHATALLVRQQQKAHCFDRYHDALFLHQIKPPVSLLLAASEQGVRVKLITNPVETFFASLCHGVLEKTIPLMRGQWPASRPIYIRCVEFHTYQPGGSLLGDHMDANSILTMSILLSDPASTEGGQFITFTADERPVPHELGCGDALLFFSERLHNVDTVTAGTRHSLVIEMWEHGTNVRDRMS